MKNLLISHISDIDGVSPVILLKLVKMYFDYTLKEPHEMEEYIEDLLKTDLQTRSDFLADPVNITENRLFPMGNYGTGMTPFYTVLSLWVGLLLLSSMLRVEAKGEYSATSQYFGKMLLFMSIAIIQAIIVALGDLYILKISLYFSKYYIPPPI